jgi:hypothetical protein
MGRVADEEGPALTEPIRDQRSRLPDPNDGDREVELDHRSLFGQAREVGTG